MPFVVYLLLAGALPASTVGHCLLTSSEFACRETNLDEFLQDFYQNSWEISSPQQKLNINIMNSNFNVIEYFPNLPTISYNTTITNLSIRNSSVEHISQNALEELYNLEELNLSWNKLRNILFVEFLPISVKYLRLSHNNVTYLDNVFDKLKGLLYLDLSYNKISIIDFNNIDLVGRLNFSHNNIKTLIPISSKWGVYELTEIDLSYNQITEFNEIRLNQVFYHLDVSYNKLEHIGLMNSQHSFLNLSGNDMINLSSIDVTTVGILEVDFSSNMLNGKDIKLFAEKCLILKNSKIRVLDNSTLNIFHYYRKSFYRPAIDLSNSSVEDISEYYFGNLQLTSLNLSRNNITMLRNDVFHHSTILMLDLSYSNIKHIKDHAFRLLESEQISLKGNKLTSIKDIFTKVLVVELDLSHNDLQFVANNTFSNCDNLVVLNLSNCLVEHIEPNAFFSLDRLEVLDLSHNKLRILDTNMFNNLHVTDLRLQDNSIDAIRTEAFHNLHRLKILDLSKVSLRELAPHAFSNLSKIEVVDLRYNNIAAVPSNLFVNMNNLKLIYLDGNNITTLNPFSNRLKLHNLTLSFTGTFNANPMLNLNIKYLNLKESNIDVLKTNSFAGLYNLVELRLDNTHILHIESGALNNLFNLKFLDSRNMFRYTRILRMETFKDLRSVQFLNLSNLSLETLETGTFVGMRSLETLLLNNNNLTHLEGGTFYGLKSLKTLDLSHSNIDSCDERSFEGLENLEILQLEFNNLVTIDSDVLFDNLGQLLELHLEHNNISVLDVNTFAGLKNIRKLHLQNNSIQEIPIGLFHHLPTLKCLNLSRNDVRLLKTGALSNLQGLEVLDLSDNELVNLEYVDIFFSLKQLQTVWFDGNYLKQFDFRRFLINLRKIKYVGISRNKWKCDTLSYIIESFNNRSVDYRPENPVYDNDNIDGVGCVDLCKFVYCSHENVEQTLHYY